MAFSRSIHVLLLAAAGVQAAAQVAPATRSPDAASLVNRVDQLVRTMEATQARIDAEQKDLAALRQQVTMLQAALREQSSTPAVAPVTADVPSTADLKEQQEMLTSQVATLDQAKVESASKYPVRIHGTILLNAFINSQRVDQPVAPSAAFGGPGSGGLSVRQTSLGLDANGPHLLGATSSADINVDFFGASQEAGYDDAGGLLRMRTAHAALAWSKTEAYIAYDRPLISPYTPDSLLAAAVPELAWSGNLWSWNPQVGITHSWGTDRRFRAQAALIDVADPVYSRATTSAGSASLAEASRRPGVQARMALLGSDEHGFSLGAGGYFAPHHFSASTYGPSTSFNAWASTLDLRVPLGRGLSFTASAYRGQALGGLGGGGYRDFVYRVVGGATQVRALEDVGGWGQLHGSVNQALSWNAGLGIDNPFAQQLRAYPGNGYGNTYENIARNRTVFANVLYSPRAYIIFSAEYRNLRTAPVQGRLWTSNVTGLGAAYRF